MKTWAVVGLGDNPARAAYDVSAVLLSKGHRVVPIHPLAKPVHGQQAYSSLAEVPFSIDVVDVFVNSSLAGVVADEAIKIGAKGVWFQIGVIDATAHERVSKAGLFMVMDRCPKIEYERRA
ncbi:MAG TPA: CoA-binding protein [Candidatus Nanopelagicaceae bacterium]|nr:CoA-binding protein [Candidatus Nanopelagicaceae bacterium]